MNKVWYYTLDGEEKYGPFSDEELVKLMNQGILTGNHYIWMTDLDEWVKVEDSIYSFYLPKVESLKEESN